MFQKGNINSKDCNHNHIRGLQYSGNKIQYSGRKGESEGRPPISDPHSYQNEINQCYNHPMLSMVYSSDRFKEKNKRSRYADERLISNNNFHSRIKFGLRNDIKNSYSYSSFLKFHSLKPTS